MYTCDRQKSDFFFFESQCRHPRPVTSLGSPLWAEAVSSTRPWLFLLQRSPEDSLSVQESWRKVIPGLSMIKVTPHGVSQIRFFFFFVCACVCVRYHGRSLFNAALYSISLTWQADIIALQLQRVTGMLSLCLLSFSWPIFKGPSTLIQHSCSTTLIKVIKLKNLESFTQKSDDITHQTCLIFQTFKN